MKTDRCQPHTHSATDAKDKLESNEALRRPADESSRQNGALEKRLAEVTEELVRQKNAFLIVSQELESLTYTISHDLRAPLRHIAGFSQALLDDYRPDLDSTAQGYLDCIVRAQRKMEGRIEAMLNLSRISQQELRPDSVDLGKLARECADALQLSAPERQATITIAEQLTVRADPALMQLAIGQLVDNAWKYTGKKEKTVIEFGRQREGEVTTFFLRDNGAGFDLRYADKLFSPFQRMHAESEFGGMGMGLALVQRIIHRHGGRIWADARVDGGATFFFTLAD